MPTLGEMMREAAMTSRYASYNSGGGAGALAGLAQAIGTFMQNSAEQAESKRRFEENIAIDRERLKLQKESQDESMRRSKQEGEESAEKLKLLKRSSEREDQAHALNMEKAQFERNAGMWGYGVEAVKANVGLLQNSLEEKGFKTKVARNVSETMGRITSSPDPAKDFPGGLETIRKAVMGSLDPDEQDQFPDVMRQVMEMHGFNRSLGLNANIGDAYSETRGKTNEAARLFSMSQDPTITGGNPAMATRLMQEAVGKSTDAWESWGKSEEVKKFLANIGERSDEEIDAFVERHAPAFLDPFNEPEAAKKFFEFSIKPSAEGGMKQPLLGGSPGTDIKAFGGALKQHIRESMRSGDPRAVLLGRFLEKDGTINLRKGIGAIDNNKILQHARIIEGLNTGRDPEQTVAMLREYGAWGGLRPEPAGRLTGSGYMEAGGFTRQQGQGWAPMPPFQGPDRERPMDPQDLADAALIQALLKGKGLKLNPASKSLEDFKREKVSVGKKSASASMPTAELLRALAELMSPNESGGQ